MFRYLLPLTALIATVQAATCGTPVLTSPTANSIYYTTSTATVRSIGYTTDSACARIYLYLDGRRISYNDLRGAGSANGFSQSDELSVGTHTMWVQVEALGLQDPSPAESEHITITVARPIQCPAPVIQTPTAGSTQTGRTLAITGTFAGTANCPDVALYVNGIYKGLAGKTGTNFALSTSVGSDGTYTILAIGKTVSGPQYIDSAQVTSQVTITAPPHVCGVPVMTTPTSAISRDTRIYTAGYTTDALCPYISVWLDGRYIGGQTLNGAGASNGFTRSDVLSPGSHTMYLAVTGPGPNGQNLPAVNSAPVTFTIALPTPCPAPTVLTPADGAVITTRSVTVTGTFAGTAECPGVYLYYNGLYLGPAVTSGNTFSLNTYAAENMARNGQYKILALAKTASEAWTDSAYDAPGMPTFTVTIPQCATPVFTSPSADTVQADGRISVSGTWVPTAECPFVSISINGADRGRATISGSTFSYLTFVSGAGTYTVNAITRSNEATSLDSTPGARIITVRTPCPTPVLSVPAASSTQKSRTLTVQGYIPNQRPDCPSIDIFVDGANVGTAAINGQSFSTTYTLTADGAHTVYVVSKSSVSSEANSPPSTSRTFTVDPDLPCPAPFLGSPRNNLLQTSMSLSITGGTTGREDCPGIDIYVNGAKIGAPTVSGTSFSTTYQAPADGTYVVTAISTSNVDPRFDSVASFSRTAYIRNTPCPTPVFTSPLDNSAQNGRALTISGTLEVVSSELCPVIFLFVDGVRTLVPINNGAFSTSVPVTTEGAHTVSAYTKSNQATSMDSATTTVTVRSYAEPCPAPVLISPKPGETSTTEIYFSGTLDNRPECGKIEVYMDGKLIFSTATQSTIAARRKRASIPFSFSVPTSQLSSGNHNVYAVVTGENNGVQSASVPIVVQNGNGPTPTGGLNRRKNRCSVEQTLCPFKMGGRLGFECVDDIETNLERCGACDGPDCTEIPNALDVACVQSQCIVSQCAEGYVLEDNVCVAGSEGFMMQE